MNSHDPDITPPRGNVLTLDLEKYLGQLDDWDITEEQKIEFIQTMWALLVSIAEVGFEIHPVQCARKTQPTNPQKSAEHRDIATGFPKIMLQSKAMIPTQINEKDESAV